MPSSPTRPLRVSPSPAAAVPTTFDGRVELPTDLPRLTIRYCNGCNWMLRASWMAQELLSTFREEIGGVEIVPDRSSPGGEFVVATGDGKIVWDRKRDGGFPEIKVLKQRVRDMCVEGKDLGHNERRGGGNSEELSGGPTALVEDRNADVDAWVAERTGWTHHRRKR